MNNEIKEILEQLKWYKKIGKKDIMFPEHLLTNKKAFLLLDYITNLHNENERIEKEYKSKVNEIGKLISIIYKAIKYIKANCSYDEDTNMCCDDLFCGDADELINILEEINER